MKPQDKADGCLTFISVLIVIGMLLVLVVLTFKEIDTKAVCAASGYPRVEKVEGNTMCLSAAGDRVPLSDLKTWE